MINQKSLEKEKKWKWIRYKGRETFNIQPETAQNDE